MAYVTWHVWTDGSCLHGHTPEERAHVPRGARGAGGWAAVVEHGSDGFVKRGARELAGGVDGTTNVRMELVAVCEGLAAIPTGEAVTIHTDTTAILAVRDSWMLGTLAGRKLADGDLWRLLGAHFDRVHVTIDLLGRGVRDDRHRRAHGIAGAEARKVLAAQAGVEPPMQPMSRKTRRRIRKQSLAAMFTETLEMPTRASSRQPTPHQLGSWTAGRVQGSAER